MEIIKSYNLFLNTRHATYGNSNNCTFALTTPIVLTNTMNRFIISTPMIEIPYSFSQVNGTNNVLSYTYVDTDGGGTTFSDSVAIPIGNYNILNLNTQFIASLISSLATHGKALSTDKFTFSYNSNTGLNTLIMSGLLYTVRITLKFSLNYVLGIMMGFNQADYTFGTALSITSPNKVFCNPITAIYLRSETLKFQTNYEQLVEPRYQNSDIIAKIPVTTLPNSIIYYRTENKSMVSNKFIPELNLYLSDNLSLTYSLDLQGLHYGINILIEEVQIKPTNSYQDQIGLSKALVPSVLIKERDELLNSLIEKKKQLETEIEQRKKVNQTETKKEIENNNP